MIHRPAELRFVTYLSPGIPRTFYEAVLEHVGRTLGVRVSLATETRISGPVRGGADPFSKGEADVGFMCAPSFLWLREMEEPPVELAGAAPVFRDDRAPGLPVYFSEVIVNRDLPIFSFDGLQGHSMAYNDPCSLSGYYNLLKKLADMGEDRSFFSRIVCSKGHLNSLRMVAEGEVDAAAIDSNVLRLGLRSNPELREQFRVIESLGPFPIQPVVFRSALCRELKDCLRDALMEIEAYSNAPSLSEFGLERFAPISYGHYAEEERVLRGCEYLLNAEAV
jgi:phosphonate transport system substrate-binding protein